jgi:hypothetical protein
MISVDSLLYKLSLKLNKLSTNEHQDVPLEDKILALNEAQIKLIKQKVTGLGGIGLNGFKKRYEDLENLIEDYKSLDLSKGDTNINQYKASVSKLNPQYMFWIDAYVLADKGECKDRPLWVNKDLVKHGDIQFLLTNSDLKPSFEYQETFNTISSDEFNIYSDGTFTPTKLFVSYLRYPKYIDKEGYINLEGENSKNQDCELEEYLEDELVDLAVQHLAMYTENIPAVQSSQLRIQTNE